MDSGEGAPTAAELTVGLAGLSAEERGSQSDPRSDAPPPAPKIRWLGEARRSADHILLHPFELDAIEHRVIGVRRLTAGEVAAFVERMRAGETSGRAPMFFVGAAPLTDVAWDAMDDEDRFALEEIGAGFLPARFRPRPDPAAS